jgi:hypothetical protein
LALERSEPCALVQPSVLLGVAATGTHLPRKAG